MVRVNREQLSTRTAFNRMRPKSIIMDRMPDLHPYRVTLISRAQMVKKMQAVSGAGTLCCSEK